MATPSEILARPVCTAAEVQDITALSRGQVYRMIGDGRLETIRVGRRILVKTESIRRLLGI